MLKSEPLVCICIPNYNSERTISDTIDSLVCQTYKNIIIKIFDNASTDDSLKILTRYERKYNNIKIYRSEINIGGEANFTKCIENMEGVYGAIYHSDDIYMPTIVEEQVLALESCENMVAISTNACRLTSRINEKQLLYSLPKEIRQEKIYTFKSQIHLLKSLLKYGNIIICPSVMGRTVVYKKNIKSWNEKLYMTSADLDVWLRFADFGLFGYLTKPLMKYRVSEESTSFRVARSKIYRHHLFLVFDDYINRENVKQYLNEEDYSNYRFLTFRDCLNIEINKILLGERANFLNIFKFTSLKYFDFSIQNLKTILGYVLYLVFFALPKNYFFRKILYKLRFGK